MKEKYHFSTYKDKYNYKILYNKIRKKERRV
ncbi:hypothetical protein B14911_06286 [Bacillus sp. NRRL B-14911]|nr:hypothetical protein B14911_06286 [Bacillus sp. NRRL B-14911]